MQLITILNFLSALAIGGLIGLEREMGRQEDSNKTVQTNSFGGVRTFMLISLAGAVSSYFAIESNNWNIFLVFMAFSLTLLIIHYAYNLFVQKDTGATTEITGILTFLTGALCGANFSSIAVVLGIFITAILLSKHAFLNVLIHIKRQEIYSTLAFAAMLFIIWPLLPNYALDPYGLFNPQQTWNVVILISGISFVGYIASKIFGTSRGIIISGIFGGLASSTAVSSSMAAQSKKTPSVVYPFVIATIIASGMMFIRAFFLVTSFNPGLTSRVILPISVMTFTSVLLITGIIWKIRKNKILQEESKEIPLSSPFQILPAVKFALFFLAVSAGSYFASTTLGEGGTYLIAFASGLADVDAISISLSLQAASGVIPADVAVRAFTIALITNTLVKVALAWLFGSKPYSKWIIITFGAILISGALSLIFA